jgi:hyperosmotically inducible protein
MNAQASRKIIVVGAMAVVVGLGVVTFAMRPHNVTRAALTATTPPVPLAESTAVEDAVATTPPPPAALAPVAPIVAAPATPAQTVTPARKEVIVAKRTPVRNADTTVSPAIEPKVAATRHVAAVTATPPVDVATAKPTEVAPDLSTQAAAATVARNSESVPGAAETAASPVPGTVQMPAPAQVPVPAVAAVQTPEPGVTLAASDTEITANVKSQIAVDSMGKNAAIGVVTTNGVVALTGSLASQDDIDHIKLVAAAVKDVKSVDTSALSVPTT